MAITIKGGGVTLPSPVSVTAGNEIIWSSNTGRSASGKMIGDVIAEKKTFAITWGVLTRAELESIRTQLISGFYPFSLIEDGAVTSITAYRGTLSATLLGSFGGVTYYKDVTVSVIQQ